MNVRQYSIAGPRGDNQDSILPPFNASSCVWCGIADGVGSSDLGGLAAQTSLDIVRMVNGNESMEEIFSRVSEHLIEISKNREELKSMGTTLSVLKICRYTSFVGHVGDTRISHYRNHGVVSRTKDQTEVQKLLDDGVISKNQARRYPRKNVLLSAMSARRDYDLYQSKFSIQTGDRILLTTDGFHNKIPRGTVANISNSNTLFDDFWSEILSIVDTVKFEDDASCLAIEIE